jgi:hypothetical protein
MEGTILFLSTHPLFVTLILEGPLVCLNIKGLEIVSYLLSFLIMD